MRTCRSYRGSGLHKSTPRGKPSTPAATPCLRLNSREAALTGGDSGEATVIPGNAAASTLLTRLRSHDEEERMPPKGEGLKPAQIATLERWVQEGAVWPAPPLQPEEVAAPAVVGDDAFLRRVFLDTVGTPPTEAEARAFLADSAPDKRTLIIERLLADERHADHWMSYWQDVLAENPTIVNKSLNTTGPFRWFLLDSLRDGKPVDRMVSELIQMRGAAMEGGSAGFGIAVAGRQFGLHDQAVAGVADCLDMDRHDFGVVAHRQARGEPAIAGIGQASAQSRRPDVAVFFLIDIHQQIAALTDGAGNLPHRAG
jgi:hypothetical protein